MNLVEHAIHLAGMVTPKDVSGYHRLKLDNERYLRTELQRIAKDAFKAGQESMRTRCLESLGNVTRYDGPFTDFGDHAEDGYGNGKDDAKSAILALRVLNEEAAQ